MTKSTKGDDKAYFTIPGIVTLEAGQREAAATYQDHNTLSSDQIRLMLDRTFNMLNAPLKAIRLEEGHNVKDSGLLELVIKYDPREVPARIKNGLADVVAQAITSTDIDELPVAVAEADPQLGSMRLRMDPQRIVGVDPDTIKHMSEQIFDVTKLALEGKLNFPDNSQARG